MSEELPEIFKKCVKELTTEQLLKQIKEMYEVHKPIRMQFLDIAQKTLCLNEEYHFKRVREGLGVDVTEEILLLTLDIRETPASLNKVLAEFAPGGVPAVPLSHVTFDRKEGKIYVFGKIKT